MNALAAQFEQTECFQLLRQEMSRLFPECADILQPPSLRTDHAFSLSRRAYERICGPLWGTSTLGRYTLVWASDMLLLALAGISWRIPLVPETLKAAEEQAVFLREVLEKGKNMILLLHAPQAIRVIHEKILRGRLRKNVLLTVAGHLHTPWFATVLPGIVSSALRASFRLVICPSLRANGLACGGGLLLAEDSCDRLRAFRCAPSGSLRPIPF